MPPGWIWLTAQEAPKPLKPSLRKTPGDPDCERCQHNELWGRVPFCNDHRGYHAPVNLSRTVA